MLLCRLGVRLPYAVPAISAVYESPYTHDTPCSCAPEPASVELKKAGSGDWMRQVSARDGSAIPERHVREPIHYRKIISTVGRHVGEIPRATHLRRHVSGDKVLRASCEALSLQKDSGNLCIPSTTKQRAKTNTHPYPHSVRNLAVAYSTDLEFRR
jgi:hypothetical protein